MLRKWSAPQWMVLFGPLLSVLASETPAAVWTKVSEGQIGPRQSPALFWSAERKQFVLLSGIVSHEHKEDRPYDVLAWDAASRRWRNDLSAGAESRGGEFGPVRDPGFHSPYFELADRDGVARIQPQQALLGYQAAYAPWDGRFYALVCGRTLRYDPVARQWQDLEPSGGPTTPSRS